MKVLFISRSTLYTAPGGDTFQIINTAKELRKLGVEVDIKLSNEKISYERYDLLHFFNLIRPADILKHINTKTKFVVSPIYVDYSEYDIYHRGFLFNLTGKFFGKNFLEYLKTWGRFVRSGEKILSWEYILWGHKKSIKYIIKKSSCLLPNSESEMARLVKDYQTSHRYFVIPNGIDTSVFKKPEISENTNRSGVLCVAQIEGRKNQLNLIHAIKSTSYSLTIVGLHSPNQKRYFEKCREISTDRIKFAGYVEQSHLSSFYKSAKVHILPSWFETTGLSTLEAAYMGCNVVVTEKGDARNYFGDMAFYCDPADVNSIKQAIEKAYATPYGEEIRQYIENNFTWEMAAVKTLEAYKEILTAHR